MNKELQKRILSSILLIPISFFFIIKGSVLFILFLTLIFFISSSEWLKICKNKEIKILGLFFLILSFYTTFLLRNNHLETFLLVIIICVSTDLGGYIFGKLLKGPKLTKISPNKTYSGMFGGFLLAIGISYFFVIKFDLKFLIYKSVIEDSFLILIILLISTVSQIGDLIISYFKRSSNIKNTGKIFPGHGGMLDRIDGMIFVFPFIYLFFNILK